MGCSPWRSWATWQGAAAVSDSHFILLCTTGQNVLALRIKKNFSKLGVGMKRLAPLIFRCLRSRGRPTLKSQHFPGDLYPQAASVNRPDLGYTYNSISIPCRVWTRSVPVHPAKPMVGWSPNLQPGWVGSKKRSTPHLQAPLNKWLQNNHHWLVAVRENRHYRPGYLSL